MVNRAFMSFVAFLLLCGLMPSGIRDFSTTALEIVSVQISENGNEGRKKAHSGRDEATGGCRNLDIKRAPHDVIARSGGCQGQGGDGVRIAFFCLVAACGILLGFTLDRRNGRRRALALVPIIFVAPVFVTAATLSHNVECRDKHRR